MTVFAEGIPSRNFIGGVSPPRLEFYPGIPSDTKTLRLRNRNTLGKDIVEAKSGFGISAKNTLEVSQNLLYLKVF